MLRVPGPRQLCSFRFIAGLWALLLFSATASAQLSPPGREILTNGDFKQGTECWTLDVRESARAQWQVVQGVGPAESVPALQVAIDQLGTANWHVMITQGGLGVLGAQSYQLSLWAKSAQASARAAWNLQQASQPYRILLSQTEPVTITDRWQQYTKTVQTIAADPNVNLHLIVGFAATTLWFASVSLQEVGGQPSVQQPQSRGSCPGSPTTAQATTPAFLTSLASRLGVALPNDVRITPPGAQVPRDVAAFSGAWAGRFENVLSHILVIEQISADGGRVSAIYANGTAPQWGITRPGWFRVGGTVTRSELKLERFPNGAQVTYRMRTPDLLDATYELAGQITRAVMQRVRE